MGHPNLQTSPQESGRRETLEKSHDGHRSNLHLLATLFHLRFRPGFAVLWPCLPFRGECGHRSAVAGQSTAKLRKARPQKIRNPLNDLLDEAQAALDQERFRGGHSPLQKFLAEKPDVAYAHFQLAYAFTALKRTAEARAEYEKPSHWIRKWPRRN